MENIYQDLAKRSKELMINEPFYGLLLLTLNKEVSETKTETACVAKNLINMYLSINPIFWDSLEGDNSTKQGILKHELLHIAFFHLTSQKLYKDQDLYNIAADLEINQYIEPKLKGPKWCGLELSTYPELNLPTKAGSKIYYELLEKALKIGISPGLCSLYDSMKQGITVVCSHEGWKDFHNLPEGEKKLIEKQIEYQLKEITKQLRSSNRGTIPGEMQTLIDALFEEHIPVVDWRSYFRTFMGFSQKTFTHKTRRKQSKRFKENPAIKIRFRKTVLVGADTSGSVSDEDIMEYWNELLFMYRAGVSITVVECDAQITNIYPFKGIIPESVKGRGGTDFQPIIDYLAENKRKYNAFVYFTDGECSAPTKPCVPALWVIASGRKLPILPGRVIQIIR